MSHLRDMEELVLGIKNPQIKDYMSEAMSCYMAKAYRACIVLTYIALFDDIVTKLGELGKVNKKARNIHDEACKRNQDQDVYESYVIDQLKANALLPALDVTFLNTLRTLRNKSAHPSGHNASAEEARFIFFESVNRFLSKPILTTTQLVEEILARLDEKHFFPSTDIGKVSAVVKKELKNIHEETYPYLVNKLLEKNISTNSDISGNASFFLSGLAYIKDENIDVALRKYAIESRCGDSKYSLVILRLLSSNGALMRDLDGVTIERVRSVFDYRIENVDPTLDHLKFSHPVSVLTSLIAGNGEGYILEHFRQSIIEIFIKFYFSNFMLSHLEGCHQLVNLYFDELCKRASSGDFDTANSLARNIKDVDVNLSKILSPKQAFTLLIHVLCAAKNGAWGAQSLRDSKFSSISQIRGLATRFIESEDEEAQRIFDLHMRHHLNYAETINDYIAV